TLSKWARKWTGGAWTGCDHDRSGDAISRLVSYEEAFFHAGVSILGDTQLESGHRAVTERHALLSARSTPSASWCASDQILFRAKGDASIKSCRLVFDRIRGPRRSHRKGPCAGVRSSIACEAEGDIARRQESASRSVPQRIACSRIHDVRMHFEP